MALIPVSMNTNGDDSFAWFFRLSVCFRMLFLPVLEAGGKSCQGGLRALGTEGSGTPWFRSCLQCGELRSSCSPFRNSLCNFGHASNILRCEILSRMFAGLFFRFFFSFFYSSPPAPLLSRRDCIICLHFTVWAAGERS